MPLDKEIYKRLVEKLIYLSHTRANIVPRNVCYKSIHAQFEINAPTTSLQSTASPEKVI